MNQIGAKYPLSVRSNIMPLSCQKGILLGISIQKTVRREIGKCLQCFEYISKFDVLINIPIRNKGLFPSKTHCLRCFRQANCLEVVSKPHLRPNGCV
jgi:hypothetical protein